MTTAGGMCFEEEHGPLPFALSVLPRGLSQFRILIASLVYGEAACRAHVCSCIRLCPGQSPTSRSSHCWHPQGRKGLLEQGTTGAIQPVCRVHISPLPDSRRAEAGLSNAFPISSPQVFHQAKAGLRHRHRPRLHLGHEVLPQWCLGVSCQPPQGKRELVRCPFLPLPLAMLHPLLVEAPQRRDLSHFSSSVKHQAHGRC